MRIGALEAGGTKMVCAVGNESGEIYEKISIPTETPEITIPRIVEYFKGKNLDALGIGCFGPVCLDPEDPLYGHITETPKTAWKGCNLLGILAEELGCPAGFDTDVNAAVLGEAIFGSAKGLGNVCYLTIGTGIGAGILTEGRLLHGNLHPEAGHIMIRRAKGDTYRGKCPYHRDCLEGLASGPAIEERWNSKAEHLSDQAAVWELEADYLAQAVSNFILTLAPQRIILGGGIMHQEQLFPLIRKKTKEILAGYISTREMQNMEEYIVPAGLGGDQGIIGCIELGRRSREQKQ